MNNNSPITKPKTKEPVTTPKKDSPWRKAKPLANPQPKA